MKGAMGTSMNLAPLKRLAKKSPQIFSTAMARGGIQFLKWANDGSPQETRKPPIRWGVLRASASAFVGSKLVSVAPAPPTEGASYDGMPLRQYQESATTISWIWNASYAAKMHEWNGGWGKFTEEDTDAGNKWLEKHLEADRFALMDMIEKEYWREAEKLDGL